MDRIQSLEIAVLIPCYNEAEAIGIVVADFRAAFPTAKIYVYDNNSTDETIARATKAGAIVRREPRQGKGNVVRRMFADVDSDVYVLVDGDATYNANSARSCVDYLLENGLDFVNGSRVTDSRNSYRPGHRFGNWMISNSVGFVFSRGIADMLSGLKVMSRRFVKSFPCLSEGFEIETEITVHALELRMPLGELPVRYQERMAGSASKLNTFRDGFRISSLILTLVRNERPMLFFGMIFLVLAALSLGFGLSVFLEFETTHLVSRLPTAVFATGLMLAGLLSVVCGSVLETVTLGRKESKRMTYLAISPPGAKVAADREVLRT